MYYEIVQQCANMVQNVAALLQKAKQHAEAKKFDPNNLLTARLAPDMFPLSRQVQIVCDGPKFMAAHLTGVEAPRHEDNEKTIDELIERTGKSLAFVRSLTPEQFKDAGHRQVRMPWMPGKYLTGRDYLIRFAVANFHFHVSMVYALLRHQGVDIGKADFIGSLPFHEG